MRPPNLPIPPVPLRLPARRVLLVPLAPLGFTVRLLLGSSPHEAPARTRDPRVLERSREASVAERPSWVASLQSRANGAQAATGSVRFARSGKRTVNDGRCLLEQAERAG